MLSGFLLLLLGSCSFCIITSNLHDARVFKIQSFQLESEILNSLFSNTITVAFLVCFKFVGFHFVSLIWDFYGVTCISFQVAPYERPALSKGFLLPESKRLNPTLPKLVSLSNFTHEI